MAKNELLIYAQKNGSVTVGMGDHARKAAIQKLVSKGLLKQAPRGLSPYHDSYVLTAKGKASLK